MCTRPEGREKEPNVRTGVLRSKETTPSPGPQYGPRHRATVKSYGEGVSYERGSPVLPPGRCCAGSLANFDNLKASDNGPASSVCVYVFVRVCVNVCACVRRTTLPRDHIQLCTPVCLHSCMVLTNASYDAPCVFAQHDVRLCSRRGVRTPVGTGRNLFPVFTKVNTSATLVRSVARERKPRSFDHSSHFRVHQLEESVV